LRNSTWEKVQPKAKRILRLETEIILDGPLIRDTTVQGSPENINLVLKDNNNNNILDIPGSFTSLTHIAYPKKFRLLYALR
jgi:hypothetical protein